MTRSDKSAFRKVKAESCGRNSRPIVPKENHSIT
jgi:hypothetical protein